MKEGMKNKDLQGVHADPTRHGGFKVAPAPETKEEPTPKTKEADEFK